MRFLRQLAEKWTNWLGDRDLDLALRKHLNEQGFLGESAQFSQLRLVAVQRPGWLQVYTFTAQAKSRLNASDQQQSLFGIVRQDERFNRMEIRVFSVLGERTQLVEQWSDGLIRLRRRAN